MQKGFTVKEKNITHDAQARLELTEKYDALGTPVIVIGDEVVMGFDRERIQRILGIG